MASQESASTPTTPPEPSPSPKTPATPPEPSPKTPATPPAAPAPAAPKSAAAPKPVAAAAPKPVAAAVPKPVVTSVAEPKPADAKPKAKRPLPIPKTSKAFFRLRAKQPLVFGFTPDGNLAVPEMRGQPSSTLELPRYRAATPEEIIAKEDDLRTQIAAVEREYDETAALLKAAMTVWRETGAASEALKYQRKMTQLDSKKTLLRSPMRWVHMFKGLEVHDVLLEKVHEVKKMPYPIGALRFRSVDSSDLVRVMAEGEVAAGASGAPSAQQQQQRQPEEETFIFFNDPDVKEDEHSALSPDTMIEIIYNSTKYTSPTQAYEAERVVALKRNDLRPQILKTRSAKMIRAIGARVVGDVEKPIDLWISIFKALLMQHPRYERILRETDTDTLVYANPKDSKWGIGLKAEDPLALSKENWAGENWVGQAWQAVREGLPEVDAEAEEEEEAEAEQAGGYVEHGVTAIEQKEKRSKVLMGLYRRR